MGRMLRVLPALVAGWLVSASSQVAIEVAVSTAFVVPLVAISIYESHRAADSDAARAFPDALPARADVPASPCRPYWREAREPRTGTRSIESRGTRCRDLAAYI